MYDTYGFPIDIITDLARDKGFDVDHAGFEERMEKQREQSRKHWKGSGERELAPAYRKLGAKGTKTTFLGYEQLTAKSKVVALVKDGELVDEARAGEQVELVTEETPFYGEAGGQVGDKGIIKGDNFLMHVIDTLKLPGDLIVHVGEIKEGIVRTDEVVELVVDKELREDTARNHTATHLLHAALREVLGDHVKQAGSLVSPKGFRFDLTHFAAITPEEIRKIEEIVNQRIRENIPLETRIMTMEEAIKAGAIALFEEKYGEKVRLVQIADVSKELCGGTHTSRTGDIGLFLIVHETSVAAGVRRIEAITGREAVAYVQKQRECINDLCKLIKTSPQELSSRVNQLLEQQKKLEKELEALKASLSSKKTFDLMDNVREIKGLKVLVTEVDADSPKILREMMDKLKQKIKSGVVILGAKGDGKVMLIAGVTDDLVAKISANDLIKKMAAIVGGGGGGRPDMAQAGGSKPEKLSEALDASLKLVEEMAS
ncbi:MAG: alanine--tRNA ligase [Deltaproteobacteria bacterium]|nr:MAG: alanine--tRNA ligase [Deltaproteobacteria bacterium]